MGCQNSNTEENEKEEEKEKEKESINESKSDIHNNNLNNNINQQNDLKKEQKENLLMSIYSGQLIKGLNFKNCLIKSQEELDYKLRMFIPTKIQKKQKKAYAFNLSDKILTNTININFDQNYIIALTGFDNVENVKNNNGNYLVCHDGIHENEEKYIALIVDKIEGEPEIIFSPKI